MSHRPNAQSHGAAGAPEQPPPRTRLVEARQEVEFAVAVAGAAKLIRGSKFSGGWTLQDAIALAQKNRGEDPYGYRSEFVQLLRQASVSRDI